MSSYFYKALVFISSVHYGISVPPEYCNQPLNKDDCKESPRSVFSYYPPGSRCEIEIWRGCPTVNMFADEFSCSDMCLGDAYKPPDQAVEEADGLNEGELSRIPMFSDLNKDGPCFQSFNGDDCGGKMEMKYFFSGDLCVRTEWRGCASPNLFEDLKTCIKHCHPTTYFEPKIEETLSNLPAEELKDIEKMIKDAVDQEAVLTELPVLSDKQKKLPHNKINDILLTMYKFNNNTLTEEEISEEVTEVVTDADENEDVEEVEESIEKETEYKEKPKAEQLMDDDEYAEGSLEEVFTLE